MSAGIVIPGVSKSVILMMLGIYPTYLLAISKIDFTILMPIAIGLVIGCSLFLVLINFLFKYVKSYTYFSIMGFILGSSFVLYPGFDINLEHIIGLILCIISFYSVLIINKQNKSAGKEQV